MSGQINSLEKSFVRRESAHHVVQQLLAGRARRGRALLLPVDKRYLHALQGAEDESSIGAAVWSSVNAAVERDLEPAVRLTSQAVEFLRSWLQSSISMCKDMVEEEGMTSQVAPARASGAHRRGSDPTPWIHDPVAELLVLEDLLAEVMSVAEDKTDPVVLHTSQRPMSSFSYACPGFGPGIY